MMHFWEVVSSRNDVARTGEEEVLFSLSLIGSITIGMTGSQKYKRGRRGVVMAPKKGTYMIHNT